MEKLARLRIMFSEFICLLPVILLIRDKFLNSAAKLVCRFRLLYYANPYITISGQWQVPRLLNKGFTRKKRRLKKRGASSGVQPGCAPGKIPSGEKGLSIWRNVRS
jgi:hypothetical protein